MTEQEVDAYKEFMADSRNEDRCEGCPANDGFFDNWQGRRPCGQYGCWVIMHNREEESDNED